MTRYVPQDPPPRSRVKDTCRALWAVFCLLIGAVDALVTAVLGITPLAIPWAEFRAEIADRWRLAYHDARDADVITEEREVDRVDP
jgi:hypothetical protein